MGCKGCFYDLGDECQIMRHKEIGGCSAYATTEEAIQREKAIEAYKEYCLDDMFDWIKFLEKKGYC